MTAGEKAGLLLWPISSMAEKSTDSFSFLAYIELFDNGRIHSFCHFIYGGKAKEKVNAAGLLIVQFCDGD